MRVKIYGPSVDLMQANLTALQSFSLLKLKLYFYSVQLSCTKTCFSCEHGVLQRIKVSHRK
jgi:hypothetical protein